MKTKIVNRLPETDRSHTYSRRLKALATGFLPKALFVTAVGLILLDGEFWLFEEEEESND